jgi:MFS superfamily sulfate permease-like transporter
MTPVTDEGKKMSQLSTLRNADSGKVLWPNVLLGYAIPVIVGVWTWAGNVRFGAVGELISGVSILAGFLFGLSIFIFELRVRVSQDSRPQRPLLLPPLVDELFQNVTYSVGASVFTVAIAIAAASMQDHNLKGVALGLEPWISGVVVALSVHLLAMLFTCLKRTRTAYEALKSVPA